MENKADLQERVTLLEQRVARLQADQDVGLSRRWTELHQLRERAELLVATLDLRLTRVERRG